MGNSSLRDVNIVGELSYQLQLFKHTFYLTASRIDTAALPNTIGVIAFLQKKLHVD